MEHITPRAESIEFLGKDSLSEIPCRYLYEICASYRYKTLYRKNVYILSIQKMSDTTEPAEQAIAAEPAEQAIAAEPSEPTETTKKKNAATRCMSKKRLIDIKQLLHDTYGDEKIDEVITKICEIMKFDPDNYCKGVYTSEKGKKNNEYKHRKAKELGKTVYELFEKKKTSASK